MGRYVPLWTQKSRHGGPMKLQWSAMYNKILQCNLGRSWDAQSLLTKQAQEMKAGVCLVSEPPSIPDSADWIGSSDGLAAIYFNNTSPDRRGKLVKRAKNFVIAEWSDIFVISVYISPNVDHSEFLIFLDDLSSEVRRLGRRTLVGGDFNSKFILWVCKKNGRKGYPGRGMGRRMRHAVIARYRYIFIPHVILHTFKI